MVNQEEILNQTHHYNLNFSTREIYLHSYILGEEESGIEYRMATQFLKNIHLLDLTNNKNILIHMQSSGGDWVYGISIYDAIKFCKSSVTILAHGEVASMSGIVFQAAKKRVLMPNCEFMVHRGFLMLEGGAATVQSNALWNKKTDKKMLEILANRCVNGSYFKEKNMKVAQIEKFIDQKIKKFGDWNLDAEEALAYGFCDGIFGEKGFETIEKIRK